MSAPLVFLDLETTGVNPGSDDIWEAAWLVRDVDGVESHAEVFVHHDANKALRLPPSFRRDWAARFDRSAAFTHQGLTAKLIETIPPKAHLVGACPWFDQEFLRPLFANYGAPMPWHYHLIDVEALAVGHLRGVDHGRAEGSLHPGALDASPPWNSDELSAAVGVDPAQFPRHTAMGDVRWAVAIYDAVMSA